MRNFDSENDKSFGKFLEIIFELSHDGLPTNIDWNYELWFALASEVHNFEMNT